MRSYNRLVTESLVLSGANNYSGSTTIAAGTLRLGANGTLPSGNAVDDCVRTAISVVAALWILTGSAKPSVH